MFIYRRRNMRNKLKGALAILDFAVAPGMSYIHSYSYIAMCPNLNSPPIFSRFLRHCMHDVLMHNVLMF